VTRLLRIIVHNWPLKLAAIGLATLLYGGLVVSSSTTTFDEAPIPVEAINIRSDTHLLNQLDPVTEVRYFSPTGRRPVASTFTATVDLADVPAGTGPVTVPVRVVSNDPSEIQVISFTPDRVTVELDPVATRSVPVTVRFEPPPAGLTTGRPTVEPTTVQVTGPKSKVDTIAAVRADVIIQPSGIGVDQDVTPIAVDAADAPVAPVSFDPPTVHVTVPVFQDVRNKTLPVVPTVTGQPAPGFEVASIVAEPSVVTVAGDAEQLGSLTSIATDPVSVDGVIANVTAEPGLAMPAGVVPVEGSTVTVIVTLRPVTVTRNFEAGLDLVGEQPATLYDLEVDQVILTLGGSAADLDRLSGATIVGRLDVSELPSGTASVPVTVDLPAGVTLVAASPPDITVTVTVAPPASPAAAATQSAAP
jgi:YbbR domain-containing protein